MWVEGWDPALTGAPTACRGNKRALAGRARDEAADALRQLRSGMGGEHQTALHAQVTDSDDGEMSARREPGPTVGQEPAGAGAGNRPAFSSWGGSTPGTRGSMVLTALSSHRHTAHPSAPLDPGLPDPDPDLDYGLGQPSPAVPDRRGQGRGPRLRHCLPSAGTPPSFGGRPRPQRRRLGFALRELRDLGRLRSHQLPSAPTLPAPHHGGCSVRGHRCSFRAAKEGSFTALPTRDSGLGLCPSRPKR